MSDEEKEFLLLVANLIVEIVTKEAYECNRLCEDKSEGPVSVFDT